MEGNAGRVEVFASLEDALDRLADLQGSGPRNDPRPAPAAQHRGYVLHIRVEAVPLEVQGGAAQLHRRPALRTGLCSPHRFLLLRT